MALSFVKEMLKFIITLGYIKNRCIFVLSITNKQLEIIKKLFTLLALTLLTTSCEVEPACECQEQTYNYSYDIPSGTQTMINVEFENLGCTDEVEETEIPNTSNDTQLVRYYKITCN